MEYDPKDELEAIGDDQLNADVTFESVEDTEIPPLEAAWRDAETSNDIDEELHEKMERINPIDRVW